MARSTPRSHRYDHTNTLNGRDNRPGTDSHAFVGLVAQAVGFVAARGYTRCVNRSSLSRRLLGVLALVTAVAGPLTSLLHGLAHAAEATTASAASLEATGSRHTVIQAPASHGATAVEATDHEALHLAAASSAITRLSVGDVALPADAAPDLIPVALIALHRRSGQSVDGEPPDFGLSSPDHARAPPSA